MDRTNKVYLAACQDYDKERVESCIRRMFNAFGGVEALLQKGKRVTVKPNLLMAREPEAATTTHPAVVEAVVRLLVEHGASVTIADSPGGPYNDLLMRRVYESSGMAQVAQATGDSQAVQQVQAYVEGLVPLEEEVTAPDGASVLSLTLYQSGEELHYLFLDSGTEEGNYVQGVVDGASGGWYLADPAAYGYLDGLVPALS